MGLSLHAWKRKTLLHPLKKTLVMIEAPEARYLTEQLSHLVKGNYLGGNIYHCRGYQQLSNNL